MLSNPHLDDLEVVAGRLLPLINVVVPLLEEGIATYYSDAQERGYEVTDDTATYCAEVRRHVLTGLKAHIPSMNGKSPMSAIFLPLGPYQVRVLHADEGGLPRPATDRRKAWYSQNDQPSLLFNIAPPNLIEIEEGVTEIEEGALVLVWDFELGSLTQFDLYRASVANPPGERMDLLAETEVEEPEDVVERPKETPQQERAANEGKAESGPDAE